MPKTNNLTSDDVRLLSKLKITAQEKTFLEKLWEKLPTDEKKERGGYTKVILTVNAVTIFTLVTMVATIFDPKWTPFANLAAVSLVVLYSLYTLLIGFVFLAAIMNEIASRKDAEKKMTFVNRTWVGCLPRRRSFTNVIQAVLGWLVIIVTIQAGYMVTGFLLLSIKMSWYVAAYAIRIPIRRTLTEGTTKMFPVEKQVTPFRKRIGARPAY